jgi:hypothetical protein
MRSLGASKVLALISVIIFVLEAIGSWPDSLAEDVSAIPLGLAFLAASFVTN